MLCVFVFVLRPFHRRGGWRADGTRFRLVFKNERQFFVKKNILKPADVSSSRSPSCRLPVDDISLRSWSLFVKAIILRPKKKTADQ